MTRSEKSAVSWRLLNANDAGALKSLLDLAFGVPAKAHLTDDFPVWDPALTVRGRVQWGGFLNGALIASASTRAVQLHDHAAAVQIIGAVAVHPDHRRSGFAIEAIGRVLENRSETCVLWGSEKSLYARFGFADAGTQKRAPLASLPLGRGEIKVTTGWSDSLATLLQAARTEGLKLDADELRWIKASKHIHWAHATGTDGNSAFVGVGRGVDLPGIVHTYGGDAKTCEALLYSLRQNISDSLEILWHPKFESRYAFLGGARSYELEVLAMVRPGSISAPDPKNLWFWGTDSA